MLNSLADDFNMVQNVFSMVWLRLRKLWYASFGTYRTPRTFEEKVQQLSTFEQSEIIDNDRTNHAEIAMIAIYKKAAEKKLPIRHVTGFLDPAVYSSPKLEEALNGCIKKKVPISMMYTDVDLFEQHNSEFKNSITTYPLAKVVPSNENLPHMIMLGDNGAVFRYETHPERHTAKLSFNCPEFGSRLVSEFDENFP